VQLKVTLPPWASRQNGRHLCESKGTIYPSGGRCLYPDGAVEGTGRSAELRLQEVPRAFSWGKGRQQICLLVCAQVENLLQQVAELQEVVRRL